MLVAAMIIGALARPWMMAQILYSGTIFNQLHYFLVGFLLADLCLLEWNERPRSRWVWDIPVLLAALAMGVVLFERHLAELGAPFLILVIYVGAFRGLGLRAIVRSPLIFTIGGMCYTIYLYHVALKSYTTQFGLTERLDGWA